MNPLVQSLYALWGDDMGVVEKTTWEPVRVDSDGTMNMKLGRMYDAPALSTEKLMALCELFGTRKIDVDGYAHRGCETCDYGSDYGHEIEVREATKNVEEFKAWLAEASPARG